VATKLAKFFGNTPEYWLTIQMKTDLAEAAKALRKPLVKKQA
jgi:plasmid maintenance system antidote protein VapI